ncbi:MAG: sulfatase-like hydrolase/transferase [Puniceicoccaceae bacterium]
MKVKRAVNTRILLLTLLLLSAPCVGLFAGKAASEAPNIVIMLADDLGWAAVSYHEDWAQTPNIDRIAHEGIELDRFYVAPMCSPTRAGLMTGRYPIRFGLARAVIPPQRNYGLDVEERTLAEALGEAGYKHRGIFGKWHLGHHDIKWHPLRRGFTHFEGHYNGAIGYFDLKRNGERDWHVNYEPSDKQGYATDLIAESASAFIRKAAKGDAPYFCYIPWNAPHSPFDAKDEDIARFSDKGQKATRADKIRAMVWSMDEGIGRVLQAIEDSGEAENTQIWFMSDNGGIGGVKENNIPLHGSKLTTFEGGVRVVASVRWPAKWKGGRKIENTMGYIDVMPTVLASAGVNPAAEAVPGKPLDGVDVGGVLSGKDKDFPERDWYSYHGQSSIEQETIAIKTAHWKLIVNGPDIRRDGLTEAHEVHLYRMPGDLLEKRNLADKNPEVVKRLLSKLVAYRKLQPEDAVIHFRIGADSFVPWKDWRIPGGE